MCTIQLLSSVFIVDIYSHIVGVDRVIKWQFYLLKQIGRIERCFKFTSIISTKICPLKHLSKV